MNDKTGLILLMTHYRGWYSSELGLQSLHFFPARARRIRIFRIGKPEYKKDVKHDKNWVRHFREKPRNKSFNI